MEETTSQVAATPEPKPQTFSEFKAAKAARNAATPATPSGNTESAAEQSETAGTSAGPTQEPQDKQKRTARTAEERAAELRAAGRAKEADKILADDADKKEYETWKASKADRDRDAEELRRLRTTPPVTAPAPPVSRETPPAASVSADPTRPKLKDFTADPANKDLDYGEVVEKWKDADDAWRDAKRAQTEAQNRESATVSEKMATARAKYADFDAILSVKLATPDNMRTMIREFDNGLDVLYSLAKDEKERTRILALPPARQLIELGYLARNLTSNGTVQTPEKPRPAPPVSRTPPPPRQLGGISPKEEAHQTATKLSEHRRNRAASRAS